MCQILGMNAKSPTDFTFSFRGFAQRGSSLTKNQDGYGLAFYEGKGLRSIIENAPSSTSQLAKFFVDLPVKTINMISHIRLATVGGNELCNVHPFQREMWGIHFCFCHNGDLPHFSNGLKPFLDSFDSPTSPNPIFNPVGETDSEAVFCCILNALHHKFPSGLPGSRELYLYINELCLEIIETGESHAELHENSANISTGSFKPIFNFLLCVGPTLQFAYCHPGSRPSSKVFNSLFYIVRSHPFSSATLSDESYIVNFALETEVDDKVAIIATNPLTNEEGWIQMKKGELVLFSGGQPYGKIEEGGGVWDVEGLV